MEEVTFGVWLRNQRRALDLSRKAFANEVGCAEVTLRRVEAGTLRPSKELASIILKKVSIPESERSRWIAFARGLSKFPLQSISSSNKALTNLPAQLTTFIGREKEQSTVVGLISKHRLVTLIGPGGVGKTRLSLKVGEGILENYADGVWLVELASLSNPALIAQSFAVAFGITAQSAIPLEDLLIVFLQAKSVLIIVDNCEHLIDACAHLIDTLLKSCSRLKILATSREPLGITGEAIYLVPSLEFPALHQLIDTFRDFASVRLLEERAQLIQFDFSLTLENIGAVVQICQRLEGIPLAIELAAAKIGILSTEQIAKQLDESFNVLEEGSRTALPRQQTLRASINWSWDLLTEAEQELMRQLSVFTGGWTLTAANAICGDDVFGLTNALVKKSLIMMNQKTGSEPRYRFHEIIRQYTNEKLIDAGQVEFMRKKHRDWFLALVESFDPRKPANLTWFDLIESEHDNLRAALAWSQARQEFEICARMAFALTGFWETRGYLQEGRKWLEGGLAQRGLLSKSILAQTLFITRRFALKLGDPQTAEAYGKESVMLFRELGDQRNLAWALRGLGAVYLEENLREHGEPLMGEALTLFREADDKQGILYLLMDLTINAIINDEYNRAKKLINEQQTLAYELEDLYSIGLGVAVLGLVEFLQGKFHESENSLRKSLRLIHPFGDTDGYISCLEVLAAVADKRDQPARAARLWGATRHLYETTGLVDKVWIQPVTKPMIASVKAQLGGAAFEVAYAEGHAMAIEEAIQYALEMIEEI